jgi:hypothetical protein
LTHFFLLSTLGSYFPADFDVKMLSREEKLKQREGVMQRIENMIAWGGNDSLHEPAAGGDKATKKQPGLLTPKLFFRRAKQALEGLERQREKADERIAGGNWNVIITGGGGMGKRSFMLLLHQFLRAYGVVESEDPPIEPEKARLMPAGQGKGTGAAALFAETEKKSGFIYFKGAGKLLYEGKEESAENMKHTEAVGKWCVSTVCDLLSLSPWLLYDSLLASFTLVSRMVML